MTILRGTARILAAATGLLLMYGAIFALEGMTTRIQTIAVKELAMGVLWISPWLLLFCSGLQDVVSVTGMRWILWFGCITALLFLYYFDHYTTLSRLTEVALPPIAVGIGLIPQQVNKMSFLFVLCSVAGGVVGGFVLYNIAGSLFSPTVHFPTKTIGLLLWMFCLSSITAGLLTISDCCRKVVLHFAA